MKISNNELDELFNDKLMVSKIKKKLPKMFQIAEIESSRAGKIGMEVGSLREKIIIALLIHKYGRKRINSNISITEPETDLLLDNKPISIKTITRNGGVKAVWTIDAQSSENFIKKYVPKCDIILIQIFWNSTKGGFYFIPLEVQNTIFISLGRDKYLKMPKPGTNPRGIEYSKEAVRMFLSHSHTKKIEINWIKEKTEYDVYKRWEEYWSQ